MVYDVPRNYIGDTHWRESDTVQDGDEFELDRGVFIQVGELVGCTEQDLRGLLEKRRKAPVVPENEGLTPRVPAPVAQKPMSTVHTPVTQPSQMLRPKPLNAVLGTPRGPIGRASLPTKSPHDQRIDRENLEWPSERAAKRQRRECGSSEKQTVLSTRSSFRAPQSFDVSRERDGTMFDKTLLSTKSYPQKHKTHVISLSSELSKGKRVLTETDKDSASNSYKEATVDLSDQIVRERRVRSKTKPSATKTQPACKSGSPHDVESSSKPSPDPTNCFIMTRQSRETIPISSNEERFDGSCEPQVRMKLQMATRKSRKKLMYRDLLPRDLRVIDGALIKSDEAEPPRPQNGQREQAAPCRNQSLSTLHQKEQDELEARLKNQNCKRQIEQRDAILMINGNQEARTSMPHQAPLKEGNRDHRKAKRKKPKDSDTRHPYTKHGRCRSASVEQVDSPYSKSKPTLHGTNPALSKMDEILLSRSQLSPMILSKLLEPPLSVNLTKERSPSPLVTTPPHKPSSPISVPSGGRTQVASSPGFQTLRLPHDEVQQVPEVAAKKLRTTPPKPAPFIVHETSPLDDN
ncbi:MAG: hypothetical protein Q9164_005668, partial [Protoblastenia rupestris]